MGKLKINYIKLMNKHPKRPELEKGNGAQFIRDKALPYLKGIGLDVGCSRWKIKPDVIGVDIRKIPGVDLTIHDWNAISSNEYDYLFSSHCLEHIENWQDALEHWVRVVKIDGIVFLYLPNPVSYNRWSKVFAKQHKHDFTLARIINELKKLGIEIIDNGYDEYAGMYVVGEKSNKFLKCFL